MHSSTEAFIQGRIQRRAIAPVKPRKITLFTMILDNSENITLDYKAILRSIVCHSSVVKYIALLTLLAGLAPSFICAKLKHPA